MKRISLLLSLFLALITPAAACVDANSAAESALTYAKSAFGLSDTEAYELLTSLSWVPERTAYRAIFADPIEDFEVHLLVSCDGAVAEE